MKFTVEELKKSSVLNEYIPQIRKKVKEENKNLPFSWEWAVGLPVIIVKKKSVKREVNRHLELIINFFESFKNKPKNRVLEYLEKIEGDYKKLKSIQTHRPSVSKNIDSLELQITIIKKYAELFLHKNQAMKYRRDLITLFLRYELKNLGYEDTTRIISNIFVLFGQAGAVCNEERSKSAKKTRQYRPMGFVGDKVTIDVGKWKTKFESRGRCSLFHDNDQRTCLDSCMREEQNIQKRLNRLNKLVTKPKQSFQKDYAAYEEERLCELRNELKQAEADEKKFSNSFKSEAALKKIVKKEYIQMILREDLVLEEDKFSGINTPDLKKTLVSLKMSKYFDMIKNDTEFPNTP